MIGVQRGGPPPQLVRYNDWRQVEVAAPGAFEPPLLPLVSVLLVTRRPALLAHALAGLARQTYPRVELVLGLHGDGFTGVDWCLADLSMPATVVRVDSAQPLGAVLNSAVAASGGTFLTKMDDDDAYGCEHLWDLVLAHEYSQAHLVEKTPEFVYLAASDMTVRMHRGCSEEVRRDGRRRHPAGVTGGSRWGGRVSVRPSFGGSASVREGPRARQPGLSNARRRVRAGPARRESHLGCGGGRVVSRQGR